jgi:3-methylornithyl-N6-L-lysine dehydrogenase
LTRLIAEQISAIPGNIKMYDAELLSKTGCTLKELAVEAAGAGAAKVNPLLVKVAVVPITAGLGTIEGFTEAIRAIAVYLGFKAFITDQSDVSGLVEAYRSDVDIAIMADDNSYVAVNLKTRLMAENDHATARGYTTALAKMAGGLHDKEVLLIGAGPIGTNAAEALGQAGAKLFICDINREKEKFLADKINRAYKVPVASGLDLEQALATKPIIFDASPAENIIKAEHIDEKTMVAAPGLPLGLEPEAQQKAINRLIHDPLQIGTAVMLFKAMT